MNSIFQDLRYALRQFRRAPGFAAGVIIVLALGIGANAAMFTILEATLFRPLPYSSPGKLVKLDAVHTTQPFLVRYLADALALRDRNHTLVDMAYFNSVQASLSSQAEQFTEQQVVAVSASPNLFPVVGVAPAFGRSFSAEEQQPGKSDVLLLSDSVWRAQFHADAAVLGRTVQMDGKPAMVIGVMPRGFFFPADGASAQVWRPMTLGPKSLTRSFDADGADMIARLRPGITIAEAEQDLSAIQAQLASLYPGDNREFAATRISAVPYQRSLNSIEQRSALLALLGAVAVLWLIACANVAGLMLARSAARRRELAVRAALGASRWRLVRQSLAEALLLSLSGGALGLALAKATLQLFRHRLTILLGPALPLHADVRVLVALLVLSLLSAVVFGVVPSLLASRLPIDQTLRQDGAQTGAGRNRHRVQRALVVGELALTVALLVSCGLLLRTVFSLRHVPLGFRTDHVFVINPTLSGYKYRDLDRNTSINQPLLERLRALPGVDAAAITTVAPLTTGFSSIMAVSVGDGAKGRVPKNVTAGLSASGPELQQVFGFHMQRGRYFNAQDTASAPPVAVVNRAFAQAYVSSGGEIGTFSLGDKNHQFKIVGVVDDYHQTDIAKSARPELVLNAAQLRPSDGFYQPTLKAHAEIALRSTRDARSLLPEISRVMQQLNPDLVASEVRTMDQIVDDSIGSQLLAAHLLETLGGLALLIALAGLYSLLAYLVTLRTRELGLRLALGAQREAVFALVLRQAGALLFTGIVAGVAVALLATKLIDSFLYGVKQNDLLTLVSASLLLMLVGAMAAWLPARRAANLEPMEALRTE